MNLMQKNKLAWKEFEKVDSYKRRTTQIKHLTIAKDLIEDCLSENPNDFNSWYLLGLVWYWFPGDFENRVKNCERALKRAVKIEPDDNWANMYLGHLFFDERRFRKALQQFEKVDSNYFIKIDLNWRKLKLDEMVLACKIYLNFQQINLEEFTAFARNFEMDEVEDIFPLEIMKCLTEVSKFRNVDKNSLRKLIPVLKIVLIQTQNEGIFDEDLREIESNL